MTMGTLPIDVYPMPTESELPASTPQWKPDPRRAALLVHDMQQYFVDMFPAGQSPVTELVANAARLRAAAADLGLPVFYTAQPGRMSRADRGLLLDVWGEGMEGTPQQRQIVPELSPRDGDVVLTKWRYSAYLRTDFAERLAATGRDQLIVCGVYGHVGILMTACDAFCRDVEVFLAADAIGDFTAAHHRSTLDYVAARCGVVASTRQLLEAISAP
ncbi:isochorismate hydrolase [Allocatelliglobosispora scoriae]|uniref:Isochorismate hydrolase n=1 Tax=Allocatelliglobosispora scoriae TaxID=643052 RepID=A0A841BWY2_9ACTN|nr:isochorismatase family protein [Allocatelliglobosispora scoriae]MBB5873637.1 isochorismate hydrolase [Allocatelliglobosispora scoriae]